MNAHDLVLDVIENSNNFIVCCAAVIFSLLSVIRNSTLKQDKLLVEGVQ